MLSDSNRKHSFFIAFFAFLVLQFFSDFFNFFTVVRWSIKQHEYKFNFQSISGENAKGAERKVI